jgi:hypothetical protein
MVIEGDGILPALAFDPLLRPLVADGTIRFCCVGTPSEDELLSNLVRRGRGVDPSMPHKHRRQAAANKAFGAWLEEESARFGIPVVRPYPFETLPLRILDVVSRVWMISSRQSDYLAGKCARDRMPLQAPTGIPEESE